VDVSAGEEPKVVQVVIRPPKPGHYTGQFSLTDGDKVLYSKRVGFVFRPEEIPPAQAPADFDAFWDATLAELDKIPPEYSLEPQPAKDTPAGKVYMLKYRSWGGRWAWAWF
jgi:hypothetical protein